MTDQSNPSLAAKLADLAASSIATAKSTHYTHKIHIDPSPGVGLYDCDCSGFLKFLLSRVAERDLEPIIKLVRKRGDSRPLARDFHAFFEGVSELESDGGDGGGQGDSSGWRRVKRLQDACRGDIITWTLKQSTDTGHVVVIAEAPILITHPTSSHTNMSDDEQRREVFEIKIYDSSCIQHDDDSRGMGHAFKGGIGQGTIAVDIDREGRPTGFRFRKTAGRHVVPICVTRLGG